MNDLNGIKEPFADRVETVEEFTRERI